MPTESARTNDSHRIDRPTGRKSINRKSVMHSPPDAPRNRRSSCAHRSTPRRAARRAGSAGRSASGRGAFGSSWVGDVVGCDAAVRLTPRGGGCTHAGSGGWYSETPGPSRAQCAPSRPMPPDEGMPPPMSTAPDDARERGEQGQPTASAPAGGRMRGPASPSLCTDASVAAPQRRPGS